MTLEVIILAAGEGLRMRASLPKALHSVGGLPMLCHVITAANALAPTRIHVVTGDHGEAMKSAVARDLVHIHTNKINWVTQEKRLGTGHAVRQAMPAVDSAAMVLILYGDIPLIRAQTLKSLLAAAGKNQLGLLVAMLENPTGLGRIVRERNGAVARIVEEKDANHVQQQIHECNTGFIAAPANIITAALAKLDNNNAQNEFYLTDIIAHAVAAGVEIITCESATIEEILGVNSQADLAGVERIYQMNRAHELLEQGVCLRDPARFDVRGHAQFGRDCVVDINVILEGSVTIGARCVISANSIIRNSSIGADSVVQANCVIEDAIIGARCTIGPFARLRPQTELDSGARIGNFVEIKQSRVGADSKINHLSYIGDSTLGKGVNIGAGVITCNYDGANKHRTFIGDNVFIGSNSQLVAPITIGDAATIGAGSTISKDVAAGTLAIGRARQREIDDWVRPPKQSNSQAKSQPKQHTKSQAKRK